MTEERRKTQIAVILLGFAVLLALGLWINLRTGTYVRDEFFYQRGQGVYRAGSNEIIMTQEAEGLLFKMNLYGEERSAQLIWSETDSPQGNKKVLVVFGDGEVVEGIWSHNGYLVKEDGSLPDWDLGLMIVINGESPALKNTTLANVLCRIAFGELERYGHLQLVFLGSVFYIVGAVCFLFPEETHFLFSRWRYNQLELSEAGIWWEKLGAVVLMVVGALFLLRMLPM